PEHVGERRVDGHPGGPGFPRVPAGHEESAAGELVEVLWLGADAEMLPDASPELLPRLLGAVVDAAQVQGQSVGGLGDEARVQQLREPSLVTGRQRGVEVASRLYLVHRKTLQDLI